MQTKLEPITTTFGPETQFDVEANAIRSRRKESELPDTIITNRLVLLMPKQSESRGVAYSALND